MLANYLKVAFRNLAKHKGYTAINIAGLAVGMASCLLILLYVQHELSYDRYHEKADHLYRVTFSGTFGGDQLQSAAIAAPTALEILIGARDAAHWRRLRAYLDIWTWVDIRAEDWIESHDAPAGVRTIGDQGASEAA